MCWCVFVNLSLVRLSTCASAFVSIYLPVSPESVRPNVPIYSNLFFFRLPIQQQIELHTRTLTCVGASAFNSTHSHTHRDICCRTYLCTCKRACTLFFKPARMIRCSLALCLSLRLSLPRSLSLSVSLSPYVFRPLSLTRCLAGLVCLYRSRAAYVLPLPSIGPFIALSSVCSSAVLSYLQYQITHRGNGDGEARSQDPPRRQLATVLISDLSSQLAAYALSVCCEEVLLQPTSGDCLA